MAHTTTGPAAWDDADAATFIDQLMAGQGLYGVAFMAVDGCIRGWSGGCQEITGFAPADVLGRSLSMIFTPEDVARELHVHELNSARLLGASEDERWHLRKDGSRFWASGKVLRLGTESQPRGFAKLFRDATHLKLRMDWLENEALQLRRDGASRDVFLATIAHELRNPLQPMALATRMLTHPSEQVRHDQAVKVLERQLGFIGRLVEDLIDMTRLGHGKLHIDHERVTLQRLVEDAVESCRDAATAKGLSLVPLLPSVPIDVEVDPGRMNQVLVNLLGNAIKFTPSGGKVTLWGSADESHFIVKVQDTGQGIAPDLQPRIFDMFTQAEGSDTRRGQGLGIGLALVKQIVSLHQGSVEVRSEGAGKGSEFLIRVPLHQPSARTVPDGHPEPSLNT